MTLLTRLIATAARIRSVDNEIAVDRDVRIPMTDGVDLVADRWHPVPEPTGPRPVVLIRSPYGRLDTLARLFAERGHQTLQVSARGTFGSGGAWNPFFHDEPDGADVVRWVLEQPWCDGRIGTLGPSYLGLTQWAIASEPSLRAMALSVTTSNIRHLFLPGGSFALETALSWAAGVEKQELKGLARLRAMSSAAQRLKAGYATVPLGEADVAAAGSAVQYFRDWLDHADVEDPWWGPLDRGRHTEHAPPVAHVAGWYDIFVAAQLDDHRRLVDAGRESRLLVGPWHHGSRGALTAVLRDSLDWMDRHLGDDTTPRPGSPVRLFVMGARRWVNLPAWPPPATPQRWYLHPAGGLSVDGPAASPPDRYRYDPADPTPGIGGATLLGSNAGPRDNRELEARADVLTFTTEPLVEDLTVIGDLIARLHVRSSLEHTDFFVRLCDVAPDGRSINLADGILRLSPDRAVGTVAADGTRAVAIPLFPTANTFLAGHRVRLQVSSGAHPLYARNLGSGEPIAKATTFVVADQEVFHDPEHPSSIELPVITPAVPAKPRLGALVRMRS
jgi:putative CocE/NonD family hydrolase